MNIVKLERKKRARLRPSLLLLASVLVFTSLPTESAFSQVSAEKEKEKEKTVSSSKQSIVISRSADGSESGDESVRIEIKDGKTWVNGVEVPEGADIEDYLPEGFDVDVLDRAGRRDIRLYSKDGDAEGRLYGNIRRRNLERDSEGDVSVWFEDDDGQRENVFVRGGDDDREFLVRSSPRTNRRQQFDRDVSRFGNELVEFGGNIGARAVGFFSEMGASPTSPEIMKLEVESRRLANELRQAEGKDRDTLSRELDELLESIFDQKTDLREQHIEKLTKQLAEEKEGVAARKKAREQIIRDRKAEITGGKKTDW